jgi:hypothetical protein
VALGGGGWWFFRGYGFVVGWVAGYGGGFHLFDQGDEAGEALFAGGLVGGGGVGGFAGAHEAMACSVVGDGLVFFACGLHGFGGGGDGGSDAGVVAGVEAVDGSGDGGDVRGAGAVEDEGGREVFAMGGEGEGFSSAPAEACDGDLSVGGGDFFGVIGGGVEVGGDDCGVKTGDGFGGGVHAGEGIGGAVVGAEAGEEVGSDDDEALRGEFVGHLLGPVAEAEDLMDEEDDGGFGLDFGVDDEGLDGAAAVLEVDVLGVAGRGVKAGLGPVLGVEGSGREGKEQSSGEEVEGAGRRCRHVEESSTSRAAATRW